MKPSGSVVLLVYVCSGVQLSEAIFCRSCHSWNNTDCVRTPSTVIPKDCLPGDEACATVLIAATGHLFRGCSSDAECTDNEGCVKCDEFGDCNSRLYPADRLACNICETSANLNCATLPYYKQFEKLCIRHILGDECVTIFDGFRVVRRECRSGLGQLDLSKCNLGSNQCVSCTGTGCNKVTVRQDDGCLQCTSDVANCANGQKVATPCEKVSDGTCYNRLNVDGILHRGCLSDLSADEQRYCSDVADRSCETCHGTGCNKNLFPANALRCVQCESEKDRRCAEQQVDDALVNPCRLQISGDRCYTRLHNDGTLDRGCYSSLPVPCDPQYNMTCAYCEGGACNRDVYPQGRRSCFQCDGLYDMECGLEQSTKVNDSTKVCRRYRQDDRCYTLLENGKVTRGCTSEFEVDVCHDLERTQCQTCDTDFCNGISEFGLRSSAGSNAISIFLLIAMIMQAAHN